eukprot:10691698-Alexandrium_andersonii.AAC.1
MWHKADTQLQGTVKTAEMAGKKATAALESQKEHMVAVRDELALQTRRIEELGEKTTKVETAQRRSDVDLATRQLKIFGWTMEDERERMAAMKRYLQREQLQHTKCQSLHKGNTPELLHFSLITFGDRYDRDEAFRRIQSNP